jgi:hypothetical protein
MPGSRKFRRQQVLRMDFHFQYVCSRWRYGYDEGRYFMNAENMWGEITAPANQRTPTSILREQASILSELTKGVLIGAIEQEPTNTNTLIYNFSITAPAINNHKFAILTLQYSITIYPLTLTDHTVHVQRQCLNEENYTATLKAILSSTQVKRVIAALLIQSQDNRNV